MKLSPEQIELIEAFLGGDDLGLSKCYATTARAGLRNILNSTRKRINLEEAVAMRNAGKSNQEIADHFGVKKGSVEVCFHKKTRKMLVIKE